MASSDDHARSCKVVYPPARSEIFPGEEDWCLLLSPQEEVEWEWEDNMLVGFAVTVPIRVH